MQILLVLPLLLGVICAFAPSLPQTTNRGSSRVFGIAEWRDLSVGEGGVFQEHPKKEQTATVLLPLLPIDSEHLVLQGQTVYLQFVEETEVRLFQQALDHHERIFGMGLLSNTGTDSADADSITIILDTMPLLEIQDYNLMGGKFGIFCTAKVVGRAAVQEIFQSEENEDVPIMAQCTEVFDRFENSNLEMANNLASMIENLIADVSDIEESSRGAPTSSLMMLDDGITRMDRYQAAYESALESDSQGYLLSPSSSSPSGDRSWRELNAVSWAAFATSTCLADDSTFRLSALDMDCVHNRLQLAMYWLSDVRFEVEQTINKF
jgi:hypothetical protein